MENSDKKNKEFPLEESSKKEKNKSTSDESFSKTVSIHNQTNAETIGTVNNNTINDNSVTYEELLTDFVLDFNLEKFEEEINRIKNTTHFEDRINNLFEDNLIFIVDNDSGKRRAFANNLRLINKFETKIVREVYFNHIPEKQSFGIMGLAKKLRENDRRDLLVIGDIGWYKRNKYQEAFFESIVSQVHTGSFGDFEELNIHMLVLVTQKQALKIKESNSNFKFKALYLNAEGIATSKSAESLDFISDLNSIEKLILFVAAFFEDLSFRNFQALVQILIESPDNNEPIVMELFKNFEEGAKSVLQVLTNKTEVLKQNEDKFFKKCLLEGKNEGGALIVEFKSNLLRNKVREYFKSQEHFFWQRQCSILEKLRLIFDPNIDFSISDGIINLIIESVKDDPKYYDQNWLLEYVYDIRNFQETENDGDSKRNLYVLFWEKIFKENLANFYYSKVARLLSKILELTETERLNDVRINLVNNFLNSLITHGLHLQLLNFTQRLSTNKSFDKYNWIKQLIERGKFEIKNAAYQWLVFNLAADNHAETWAVIKTWLPDTKDASKYSPSNRYACFFIVHYYLEEIKKIGIEQYGSSSFEHILFQKELSITNKKESRIDFVFSRLFHSGTEIQFSNNFELLRITSLELCCLKFSGEELIRDIFQIDTEDIMGNFVLNYTITYYTLVADLIETWYHIIKGFKNEYTSGAKKMNSLLLKKLLEKKESHFDQYQQIITHWERKPKIYKDQLIILKTYLENHSEDLSDKDILLINEMKCTIENRSMNIEYLFMDLSELTKNR